MIGAAKFEEMVRRRGLAPLPPIDTRHGRILIADGYVLHHKDFPQPHFQTFWAVQRNGMDFGRPLFCTAFSTQPERIKAAVDDAHEWIRDNTDVGRY